MLNYIAFVYRKTQYKDVYKRTIEILQRACIFKANCCLKVHNAPLKLASPIRDKDLLFAFKVVARFSLLRQVVDQRLRAFVHLFDHLSKHRFKAVNIWWLFRATLMVVFGFLPRNFERFWGPTNSILSFYAGLVIGIPWGGGDAQILPYAKEFGRNTKTLGMSAHAQTI